MAEYSEVNQRSATRVAVVGMGIVSPLGIGITETATAGIALRMPTLLSRMLNTRITNL